MKNLYIFFFLLSLMNRSMAQWVPQNSGTTKNLHSVFFTEPQTGYTVGDSGIILKTTDGINWTIQTSGTIQNLYSVFFTGHDTGYIAGDSSVLLKTVNGGLNWIFQNSVNPVNLTSIHFATPDTGYAVGNYDSLGGYMNNAYVLKTTNGGTLWSLIDTMLPSGGTGFFIPYLQSVFFINGNVGYKVGLVASMDGPHGLIMKTTNGGLDWTALDAIWYCRSMTSIYFTGADTGYVTSDFTCPNWNCPHNIKTTDAGNSWTSQNIGPGWTSRSVYFLDVNTGYVVGGTFIAKTLNGGTDWSYQTSGTANDWHPPIAATLIIS